MLFDDEDAPPAAPLPIRPPATPLFGLPLPADAPPCGTCTRWRPVSPFEPVTGRCKLGIWPGFINRQTTGCNIHRASGAPVEIDGRGVRP